MARLLLHIFPLLMLVGSAYAETPQDAPPSVGAAGVIAFLVIFVGLIVGFFWYYWASEKKRQREKLDQGK